MFLVSNKALESREKSPSLQKQALIISQVFVTRLFSYVKLLTLLTCIYYFFYSGFVKNS